MKARIAATLVFVVLLIAVLSLTLFRQGRGSMPFTGKIGPGVPESATRQLPDLLKAIPEENNVFEIERILMDSDKDTDGVADQDDFIQGARQQVERRPRYISDYYQGGYPPEDIAVCTDIVWRAFKNAGYDLKSMVDADIKNDTAKYPRVNGKPDPNIDFRRVKNLTVFFKTHAQLLTTEVKPYDRENLKQWQGGDLVTFRWGSTDHIAVVSDKRQKDGVPYIIHTYGSYPREDTALLGWADTIAHHFRYPKE